MATSTILRVKRKIEDNPQDALVLLCKRLKTDTTERQGQELSPSLFVFQGTVDNQENSGVKIFVPKNDFKLKAASNVSDIIQKIRNEKKEAAQESRYKVVNYSRGLKDDADNCKNFYDLVDLQKATDEEKDVQYAYDLYVSAKQQDFDVSMLDNLVSIENYETSLIFDSHRDNGLNPSDDEADDDDDSNDENNWRNDYPDTENSSINEEDMVQAMKKCDIDDDLSSDTGEDKIYDGPDDLFNEDAKKYGAAYAAYKARVITEDSELNSRSLVHCSKVKDLDEESIEGYKGDEDGFYYGQDEDNEQFREQYGNVSSDEYSPD